MSASTSDLRIRNCTAADFEFACPKAWANMRQSFSANVRHCDTCDRQVYICHTDKDLALYTSLNYCIAIPGTKEDSPVPVMLREAGEPSTNVVARLTGVMRREGQFGKAFDE